MPYALLLLSMANPVPGLPAGFAVEDLPRDPKAAKVVFVAGSSYLKPGEHEYVGGCAVLMDLVRQTRGVAPVLAIDWPKKPETLAGAKCVVLLLDGAEKHALLKEKRMQEVQKLADAGTGLVLLHQAIDVPKDFGERMRGLAGGAWEKGYSQRAHWVAEFSSFPAHPITRGVKPFKIDDGWLWKMRFAQGVTPLLRTASPKATKKASAEEEAVAWAFESGKARAFVFTGGHLHASLKEEGYRRFLVNGVLWSAGVAVPKDGAPVALDVGKLDRYLVKRTAKSVKP